MFEQRHTSKVSRFRAAIREALGACDVISRGRQIVRAALCLLIGALWGAVSAGAAIVRYEHSNPAPVEIRQPALELLGHHLTVVKIGFAYRGVESVCRFVIHHNAAYDWSARC